MIIEDMKYIHTYIISKTNHLSEVVHFQVRACARGLL